MIRNQKLYTVPLFFILFYFGFIVINTSADSVNYEMDLRESTCLSNDLTTGPIGWYCDTPSGPFMISFFGVNKAGVNGNIVELNNLDCNSFSIDIETSKKEITFSNKPPAIGDDASFSGQTIIENESIKNNEPTIIKEGVTTFSNLIAKDSKRFTVSTSTLSKNNELLSSANIECFYLPPPHFINQ